MRIVSIVIVVGACSLSYNTETTLTTPVVKTLKTNTDSKVDTSTTEPVITVNYIDSAVAHLKTFEGFRSKVYLDVDGSRTIGYGHHLLSGENYANISEKVATDILMSDFTTRLNEVEQTYDVCDNKAIALALLGYNLGMGGLSKAVHKGLITNPERFLLYCHYKTYTNGVWVTHKSSKLLQRRTFEYNLFTIK